MPETETYVTMQSGTRFGMMTFRGIRMDTDRVDPGYTNQYQPRIHVLVAGEALPEVPEDPVTIEHGTVTIGLNTDCTIRFALQEGLEDYLRKLAGAFATASIRASFLLAMGAEGVETREGSTYAREGAIAQGGEVSDDALGERLNYLRAQIEEESISWGEIHELQGYGEDGLIPEGDVVLREWAGVPEHEEDVRLDDADRRDLVDDIIRVRDFLARFTDPHDPIDREADEIFVMFGHWLDMFAEEGRA